MQHRQFSHFDFLDYLLILFFFIEYRNQIDREYNDLLKHKQEQEKVYRWVFINS